LKFTPDDIDHGDQVFRGSVSSGPGFGCLDKAVDPLKEKRGEKRGKGLQAGHRRLPGGSREIPVFPLDKTDHGCPQIALIAPIHDRMPVLVPKTEEDRLD